MKQLECPKDTKPTFTKKNYLYGRWYQIQDKLINHTSYNQVNCKINDINVNRDVLTHPHNLHCKINQQQFLNNELLSFKKYITFIYNTVLFLNIMFRHNMSFTYTSNNVLLKIGIIFSLFFGPDKHKFLNVQS
jgi:hypothetical protein